MNAEKLKTDVRKEQIAQAALEIIAEHGLRGMNVGRIARRVGLVPSAIYRHYRGKGELLDAVLSLIEQRLIENVELARTGSADPLDRLRNLLRLHVKFIRENRGVLRIIFSEALYNSEPAGKMRMYGMIRRYLRRVEDLVREGQEHGSIRSDLNAETASIMFLGLIQPAAILWSMSAGEFDVTRHSENAWSIFSDAISA